MTKKLKSSDARKKSENKSPTFSVASPEPHELMEITSPLHLFYHLRASLAAKDQISTSYRFAEMDETIVEAYEEFGMWRVQDTASMTSGLLFTTARPELEDMDAVEMGRNLIEAWVYLLDQSASPFGERNIGFEHVLRILIDHLDWKNRIKATQRDGGFTTFKTSDKSALKIGALVNVTVRIGT